MPMLDNWILSYATAIALSVFMVAIALRIPKAYKEGNQGKLILGYIFVASFSVLLNFNAIYGVFTSEKLLYEELKENKSQLTSMRVSAKTALDAHYDTRDIERKLTEAKALLKEETTNRVEPGYGKKARKLNKEVVIPLEAQMETIKSRYDPAIKLIDSVTADAQIVIDAALASGKIKEYRKAVDKSIDAHAQIGQMTTRMVGEEKFDYQPIVFQHRDVGNLNHSLWTLTNIGKLESKQASSVIVSMLLSLLIDFIVLFVIVMINRPAKEEKDEKEEEVKQMNGRNSFGTTTSPSIENTSSNGIYAHRKSRAPKPSHQRPYKEPVVMEEKEEEKKPIIQQIQERQEVQENETVSPPVWEVVQENMEKPDIPENEFPLLEENNDSKEDEMSIKLELNRQEEEPKNGFDHSQKALIS